MIPRVLVSSGARVEVAAGFIRISAPRASADAGKKADLWCADSLDFRRVCVTVQFRDANQWVWNYWRKWERVTEYK